MDISFVIVNYNSLECIRGCIESIQKMLGGTLHSICQKSGVSANYESGFKNSFEDSLCWEIVVVDNGSVDGSVGYLKNLESRFENIALFELGENKGFSFASNLGAKMAKGEFLLFLNPDTLFIDGNLKGVLDFYWQMSKAEKVGVIGVKIVNQDGSLQYSARSFPTISRQLYESFFLYRIFRRSKVFGSYFLSWWDHKNIMEVDWVSGAFLLVRKVDFGKIGGFDENYFMFSEDCDLCLKFIRAGYKNYYFPFFTVIHLDSAIASRNMALREAQIWKSRRLYFRKNYSPFHGEVVSFIYFLGVINRIILFCLLCGFNLLFALLFVSSYEKRDNHREAMRRNIKRLLSYLGVIKLYFSGI